MIIWFLQGGILMSKETSPKKIEIVQGNVDNLNISEVRTHLNIERRPTNKKKGIVIPREKQGHRNKKH